MSQGLVASGLDVVAGIDVWDKAVDSYRSNFPSHQAICTDLRSFPPEKFEAEYNKGRQIDILTGGPPCQGFSIAGKRAVDDPRNSLFMEYVKYLNYYNPKSFIMENVIGILSAKTPTGEKAIDVIMERLSVNYNCIICKLYASDFEVPQNRRRVIVIGIRKDLNIVPTEPIPCCTVVSERPAVGEVLQPRSEIEPSYYLSQRAIDGMNNRKAKARANGNGFGAQILDLSKPSYTISARYWKDGSDALVKYSESEIRRLTVTELQRIQGFSEGYILKGNNKEVIMQIGNAVAGRFAYHLGKHVQALLGE